VETSLTRHSSANISTKVEILERVVNASEAIVALNALSQEHRLAVFRLLVQAGRDGMPAGAIAEALGVPNSSLSFHLAHLHRARLVSQERRSRSLIYAADYATMNALVGYLMENCCAGASCVPDAAAELERIST
jgi:DNA-binding transcriptional ArsR family regulator